MFPGRVDKKIPEYKEKYNYLENKRIYWDMLKMEIRSVTIYYCKRIAKEKKNEEAVLQQQLSSLHRVMCESPSPDIIAKHFDVNLKLGQIPRRKTERAMSKAR